ncbi:MAG TPA: CoA transferase [Dehalococcoidia bacterium]|jgi:crotonobetainyl-CoA:carnitine CoA-transferase CaiB-like acyl-CoA transferase
MTAPRALDVSAGVGAAYTAKLLAEAGWDVLKVETAAGDPLRRQESRWGEGAAGAFAFVNYGKRSVVVADRATLTALAVKADVVVGDFSPQGCEASPVTPSDYRQLEPKLAIVSVSAFGLTGPRAGWASSDLVAQAASGLLFLTGEWDQPPMQLPPYAAAMAGGLAAASATLAAARAARRDGAPRRVDVSMVEALAAHTYQSTSRYVYRGHVMRREQRVKQALRMVPASDRFVYCAPGAIATVDMKGVSKLIGVPELAEERFQTAQGRMENWDEYLRLFVPPFAARTAMEWFEEAEMLDLTFALVQTIDDLFACPQLEARNFFREVPGRQGKPVRVPGAPFQVHRGPGPSLRPAPSRPGEHTAEVLREWLS